MTVNDTLTSDQVIISEMLSSHTFMKLKGGHIKVQNHVLIHFQLFFDLSYHDWWECK